MTPRDGQTDSDTNIWLGATAGFCASFVALGIARFAYTPLIPALIAAQWYTPSEADYLGAANLAGYLAGAMLGRTMLRRVPAAQLLRLMMALTAASLFACAAHDLGLLWANLWRFVSGYTGGAIMVLAAPLVVANAPPSHRGLVSGIVFAGAGSGIIASGIAVPWLNATAGPLGTWLGLGAICAALTVIAWAGWPKHGLEFAARVGGTPGLALAAPILALFVEYAFNAVGLVPYTLFFLDYIARGLQRGMEAAGGYWVIYGIGATIGPVVAGEVADYIGFSLSLRLAFLCQAIAVGLAAFTQDSLWLGVSAFGAGALTIGIVALVLGRLGDFLDDPGARQRAWAIATVAFSIGQALAAYSFSWLFAKFHGFPMIFLIASFAMIVALAIELVMGRTRRV